MQLFLVATFTFMFPDDNLALMLLPGMRVEPLPMVAGMSMGTMVLTNMGMDNIDLASNTAITLAIFFLLPVVLVFLLYFLKHIFAHICCGKTKLKKNGYEEI